MSLLSLLINLVLIINHIWRVMLMYFKLICMWTYKGKCISGLLIFYSPFSFLQFISH